jgi:ribosomal protein S18 acetylase RimI-like enzyme
VHLADLYVVKSARRKGVGRALMAAVARECRKAGGTWVAWYVQRDNREARGFYRAIGAKQDADIPLCADVATLENAAD